MGSCLFLRQRGLAAPWLRRVAALSGVVCITTLLHTAALAQPALSLDEAIRLASAQSPQAAAAQAQARAAREMARAAALPPEPVLKLGLNNLPIDGPDRGSLTRDFMTMRSVGVMQEFTRADKLQTRSARAEREAELAEVAQRQARADVQRDAALAWLERSLQQSLRELLQEQAGEAELQVQAAEAMYRGGRGAQADVFAARTEVEELRDRIEQAERAVSLASTQLARWIGAAAQRPGGPRPTLAPPAWADELLDEPAVGLAGGPAGAHSAAHLAEHPQIAAAAQQERLAQADVAVARAERRGDWSAELTYSQRGSAFSNMVSLNFSLPLPWSTRPRQQHELGAALALAERAGAEREERERAHRTEVRSMLQEWRGLEQRRARHDTRLLPLARQRGEAALAAYRAGSGPLDAVLQARRAVLDVHAERLRIESSIARLWARLNYLIPHADDGAAPQATTRSQP